jgi:hypothetical protein
MFMNMARMVKKEELGPKENALDVVIKKKRILGTGGVDCLL